MRSGAEEVTKLHDDRFGFDTYFNRRTGEYLRTGILDAAGADTGSEPFMASFPHLMDIGIMGHCAHGASGLCREAGDYCYQSGASIQEPNMALADFKRIAKQCAGRAFQFALCGRGDPDQHEDFEAILSFARECDIVPNMTTSGYRLDRRGAGLIAAYCGACAVSWYRNAYTSGAIDLLLDAGAKVNIHFVLSGKSIDEAIDLLENEKVPEGINRIVFLLFKPVGQGRPEDILRFDEKTAHLLSLIDKPYGLRMTGFDSCFVPGILNGTSIVDPGCYDACEAGRFSAYVTPDMAMVPCSFDQERRWGVPIRTSTIEAAWNSQPFDAFRSILDRACPDCEKRENCLGGCPIIPEITLCNDFRKRGVNQS